MRHVGILGHGIEGATFCLLEMYRAALRAMGPHQHPDVTLDCISMARSVPAWETGDHRSVRATLSVSAERLARAGAEFFVCPNNTAHLSLEQAGEDLALPGLHIADVVAEQAARAGHRRIGLLGTKYTVEGPIYPRALGTRGMDYEVPEPADRETVDAIIFAELVNGIFLESSRRTYVEVIERLRDRGCDAVALVCTEIPLLIKPQDSPLPTLPSTTLLAHAALEVALGKRPFPTWRGGQPAAPNPR